MARQTVSQAIIKKNNKPQQAVRGNRCGAVTVISPAGITATIPNYGVVYNLAFFLNII